MDKATLHHLPKDAEQTEDLMQSIKSRAKAFVEDNYFNPTKRDFILIENAMLVGSLIATRVQMEEEVDSVRKILLYLDAGFARLKAQTPLKS
jgi:hypothetical protein